MTTDDAKEWVTVKVPKPVRDDARDDPRTYGEVMRAGLENDSSAGDGDMAGQLDAIQRKVNQINGAQGHTVEKALEIGEHGFRDIDDQLDRNYEAIKEATQAAQAAERAAEELSR